MADNFTTPVPSGTEVATKDIGGAHYPKNIVTNEAGVEVFGDVGASPAANTVLGRLKAIADALLGTVGISASSLPLPSGAATSAKQDAIVSAIEGAEYFPATQPISGNVGVTGSVAVTGTFFQATQPVSLDSAPLPTGAATAAKQDDIIAALGGTLEVSADALPLPTGAATAAKQDDVLDAIDASSLAALVPFPITPGSSALSRPIKALAIATGGTVVFTPVGGGGDVTVTLPAGFFPLPATHILSGGTAEGLTGF